MRTAPRTLAAVLLPLLLGTALTACGSGSESEGGGDATGFADDAGSRQAYEKCLTDYGLELSAGSVREEGVPAPKLGRAYRECRSSAPTGLDVPVTAWEVALLRDYVTCMREQGYDGYTDPDPATGEFEVPAEGVVDKNDDARCLEQADQKADQ